MRPVQFGRKIAFLFIAAIALMALLPVVSRSAETASAQFLNEGAGARAAAMGSAGSAISDDVTGAYWNPGALVDLDGPQLSFMQDNGLLGTNYQYLGAGMPSGKSALAVSIYRQDFGSIDRVTAQDAPDGSFTASSLAGGLTMATRLSQAASLGLTAKYISESIDTEQASSYAADAGLLLKFGPTRFAAVLQNLGPGIKFVQDSSPLPMALRLGAGTELFSEKLILEVDVSKPRNDNPSVLTGVEYRLYPSFALRAGYSMTPANPSGLGGLAGFTSGIGLRIGLCDVDYAFVPYGDLGSTQRLSLLLHFK